jgi:hypothetical protein
MSLSSNSVAIITIEANSQGLSKASKALSLLLSPTSSPNLRPNKLGIHKEIPSKTLVVPKDLSNNNNPDPKTLQYFNYNTQLIINNAIKVVKTL